MYPHEPLRVCLSCRVKHYENCPDCLGWGRYVSEHDGERYAVFAAQAHGGARVPGKLEPCPTCGSTINGPPSEVRRVGLEPTT